MGKTVSIIVPCYNEQENITIFYQAITNVFKDLDYKLELIYINDGSKDQTLEEIHKIQAANPETVHFISFSRNFGKEAAIYAGLEHATGDLIGLMDVDLQDPPELIPQMIAGVEKDDYDIVGSRRVNRIGEPKIRSFLARCYYKVINRISDIEIVDGVRDFRIMSRQVVDAILELKEYNRFSKGIFSWVGFKTKYLEYENQDRVAGETSWSLWGLLQYSIDGIISFSEVPLSISVWIGLITCLGSFIALIIIILRTLIFGDPTPGWPSLISIFLFVSGIILMILGIIGKYLGKVFLEVKKRPIYIIKEQK